MFHKQNPWLSRGLAKPRKKYIINISYNHESDID
jgi:hypothetical protein